MVVDNRRLTTTQIICDENRKRASEINPELILSKIKYVQSLAKKKESQSHHHQ